MGVLCCESAHREFSGQPSSAIDDEDSSPSRQVPSGYEHDPDGSVTCDSGDGRQTGKEDHRRPGSDRCPRQVAHRSAFDPHTGHGSQAPLSGRSLLNELEIPCDRQEREPGRCVCLPSGSVAGIAPSLDDGDVHS